MQPDKKSQQLHHNILGKGSMEGQDQHGQTEYNIQCESQIEYGHGLADIAVQQSSAKQDQKTSRYNQH